MVKIICRDGQFLAKGSFSLGITGKYKNKSYDDENITIGASLEDVIADLQSDDPYFWKILSPHLVFTETDGSKIAQAMTAYYNKKEEEALKNISQINNCILSHLFHNLSACGFPFWEVKEAIFPKKIAGYSVEMLESIYADADSEINRMYYEFDEKPNNGSIVKTDVEATLKKLFPMFNLDGLIKSIVPEGVVFNGCFIEFQCSDGWDGAFLDAASDSLDENFMSTDWHNH